MTRRPCRPPRAARRGVLMLAVLVVLAVAALVAGGLLAASEAEHAGLAAMRDRTQQRAIAWSGCQAVASLLAGQRPSVADGDVPQLPEEILLFEADGSRAVARLLPLGPAGETLVPEFSKFSLGGLDPALLEATGVLDARAAAAAVARGRHADAIEAIVSPADGLTARRVIGPVASGIAAGIRGLRADPAPERIRARVRALAVADVATPFAAQRALGAGSGSIAPRVPVAAWGEAAIAAIDARTSPGTGARMRDALGGAAPSSQGDLVRAMRVAAVPPASWGPVLDAVVAGTEPVERGQVDASSAPEEVLRAIPAIGPDRAARIVQARSSLGSGERADLSWLVASGALAPEEFEAAAPMLCARSWLWRARIATGMLDDPDGDPQLRGIEVWEVVVDLAEDPPRFASLRDCTLLPVAVALAEDAAAESEAGAGRDEPEAAMADASDAEGADDPDLDREEPHPFDAAPGGLAMPDDGPARVAGADGDSPDGSPGPAAATDPGTGATPRPSGTPRPAWSSSAAQASRRAEERRDAEDEARRRREQADARRRAGDSRADAASPPAASAGAPAAAAPAAPAPASSREWRTLAEREREERESRSKEWTTLGERERAERDARRGEWKSQAEQERDARAARGRGWGSLAEEERQRREKRDAAERARRDAAWQGGPAPFRGSSWERRGDLPATGTADASRPAPPGREPERTSSSGSPAGGLSGRWRRRE